MTKYALFRRISTNIFMLTKYVSQENPCSDRIGLLSSHYLENLDKKNKIL